ncbi:MAG: TetR/AcrR family transcriptional regulator [Deltaproteobacteria bacterium]|nr:TetR/AcrR family transcriptional regulator [Deltaproteobacteria bacterium]
MARAAAGEKKTTRTRQSLDTRRAQLIAQGMAFFGTRPYDTVSIDDIAEAAGISKGLLYHYFPTKRDYYAAVLEAAAADLRAQTLVDPTLAPDVRMRAGLEAYLDFVKARGPAYVALMRGGIGSDPVIAGILDRVRGHFVDMIVKDLPPHARPRALRVLLRGWVGFVEVTSLAWLESPPGTITKAHLIDTASSMLVLLLGELNPAGASAAG